MDRGNDPIMEEGEEGPTIVEEFRGGAGSGGGGGGGAAGPADEGASGGEAEAEPATGAGGNPSRLSSPTPPRSRPTS